MRAVCAKPEKGVVGGEISRRVEAEIAAHRRQLNLAWLSVGLIALAVAVLVWMFVSSARKRRRRVGRLLRDLMTPAPCPNRERRSVCMTEFDYEADGTIRTLPPWADCPEPFVSRPLGSCR